MVRLPCPAAAGYPEICLSRLRRPPFIAPLPSTLSPHSISLSCSMASSRQSLGTAPVTQIAMGVAVVCLAFTFSYVSMADDAAPRVALRSQDQASEPATYFVDANRGDDSNDGLSTTAAFKTIQAAADVVQPGETVFIRGGTYRETVRVPRSGKPGQPIRFASYRGEPVTLSGCDLVTEWTRHEGDIWKASNDWNLGREGAGNTLLVNGELKFEARQGAENDPLLFDNWGRIEKYRMRSDFFAAKDLKGWGDDFWNGAKVRHHTNDWTFKNSVVADYDSATGAVRFEESAGVISQKQEFAYYLFGTLKALDKPGEWFKDLDAKTLYYQTEPGQTPSDLNIAFKKRPYAFDLRGRSHIRLQKLYFEATSIRADGNTHHNLYDGNRFYAYDKGKLGRIYLAGDHNTFRDNEVSHTWGSVLLVGGNHNHIVNNFIHDIGYDGITRVLSMSGKHHLVSYNTFRKFARSFLDGFPYKSEFAYNVFEDGAHLSWDTGVFDGDSGRGNGGGCIIHHNVFRNSNGLGIYCAFYAGVDLVIHHNIIHGITPNTIRGGYFNFLKYYHNTFIGTPPLGNLDRTEEPVESNYNNNLQLSVDNYAVLGVDYRGNHFYKPEDFVDYKNNDFRLAEGSQAIDAGIVLPGINDGFRGEAPDAGALEHGEPMWRVGHDFSNRPDAEYRWEPLPGTNVFDNGLFSQQPTDWQSIGTPEWYYGNAWNTLQTGLSRAGGRGFKLEPGDGIRKTIEGLKPNTRYVVATETKLADQDLEFPEFTYASTKVTKGKHRDERYVEKLNNGEWLRFESVDFGAESDDGTSKYDLLELVYTRPVEAPKFRDCELEVRLDAPDGKRLGTLEYNPALIDSWFTSQIELPKLSGKQTLVFVAKGVGAGDMWLASVRLLNSNIAPDDKLSITAQDFGGDAVTTRVGHSSWRYHFEEFAFTTGADAKSVDLLIENKGIYDAYLDRLAIYEKAEPKLVDSNQRDAADQAEVKAFGKNLTGLDLGDPMPVYGIRLTASAHETERVRVAVWQSPPGEGRPVWQRDYLTTSSLAAGETLALGAYHLSEDGDTQLKSVEGQFITVQPLATANSDQSNDQAKAISQLTIQPLLHDETDLVQSDGSIKREDGTMQIRFAQQIDIGKLFIETRKTTGRRIKNLKVAVWDRTPEEGGKVIWERSGFAVDRGPGPKSVTLLGDDLADDGKTRLASVASRCVIVTMPEPRGRNAAETMIRRVAIHSMASVPPKENVALSGIASQSSDYYPTKDRASNVNNAIVFPAGDASHTNREANAWWQVDLQQTPKIDQIVIFNRGVAGSRIGNFRVSLWDTDPATNPEAKPLWNKDYSYRNGDLPEGGSLTINGDTQAQGTRLDRLKEARYVRVQLLGRDILSLAEVQIWAAKD